jgi:hypothetical protein
MKQFTQARLGVSQSCRALPVVHAKILQLDSSRTRAPGSLSFRERSIYDRGCRQIRNFPAQRGVPRAIPAAPRANAPVIQWKPTDIPKAPPLFLFRFMCSTQGAARWTSRLTLRNLGEFGAIRSQPAAEAIRRVFRPRMQGGGRLV